MITKTLSGIPMLDEPHGGVFSNRSFLVTGAKTAGKTVMGLQFTRQGMEQNERCLYLSTMVADDLTILAQSMGFDLTPHLESETLTLLEYETFIHGNGTPGLDMLPPEGFEQLKDIINTNSIERVVLDTVLPWVSVRQPDRMPEQVFSFTRSFDRLGVTTMLTLPKPVSSLAYRLKKSIEDIVPISILLQPAREGDPALFQVVKYLGEKKLEGKRFFRVAEGEGMRPLTAEEADALRRKEDSTGREAPDDVSPEPQSASAAAPPTARTEPDAPAEPPSIQLRPSRRPRFSSITFDHTRESPPPAPDRATARGPSDSRGGIRGSGSDSPDPDPRTSPDATDRRHDPSFRKEPERDEESDSGSPPAAPPGVARLSSIWKPHSDERSSS